MAPTTRSKTAKATDSRESIQDTASEIRQDDSINASESIAPSDSTDSSPPVYIIDLSLPPEQRYVQVAQDFQFRLSELPHILDDLLQNLGVPKRLFHVATRLLLRKLYHKEQTQELKGISTVTGVPMYLLVAYNVLLDTFMGCTSGGIQVKKRGKDEHGMMLFRTLDWGMPELRKVLAQFEFVERPGGEVIARTINYVGFVGVLTGVRKGLSLALNFRPYHNDDDSIWSNCKFWSHLGLVLLGFRPCIVAHLRDLILPRTEPTPKRHSKSDGQYDSPPVSILARPTHNLDDIKNVFPSIPTTAAYLTFCTPTQTIVLEKDRVTANILSSNTFIVTTNHDTSYERLSSSNAQAQAAHVAHAKTHHFGLGMQELVEESITRKECISAKWEQRCKSMEGRRKGGKKGDAEGVAIEKLKDWVLEHPVTNEETHFVTIIDPDEGELKWVKCFEAGEIKGEEYGDEEPEA